MMAHARADFDITDIPELRRLIDRAREIQEPIVLKVNNEEVGTITPVPPDPSQMVGVLTREQYDAVMSAAGGWKGLIDGEKLKAEIKAARGSRQRTPEW